MAFTMKNIKPSDHENGEDKVKSSSAIPLHPVQRKRPYASSFLEHLVRNKIITDQIATEASDWLRDPNGREKKRVVDVLVDEFGISREVLAKEVAQFYSFRIIDANERSLRRLSATSINKLLDGLPGPAYRLAMRHKVMPFETAEGQPDKILVVTPNPSDREAYEVARSLRYAKFEICYMKESDWNELWKHVSLDKQQSVSGGGADSIFEENDAELDSMLDREIDRSQLVTLVANIFLDAVRVGASDIHI
ncbi:MAG: hypothetical protein HY708_06295, partial [Ignavibacteriae bacterium]|nr:hypothetical protein [Ignavibacteriota bacterium]